MGKNHQRHWAHCGAGVGDRVKKFPYETNGDRRQRRPTSYTHKGEQGRYERNKGHRYKEATRTLRTGLLASLLVTRTLLETCVASKNAEVEVDRFLEALSY